MSEFELKEIFDLLCVWYRQAKRDLPWRNTKNPYHIWVSEIMLQQTRVEAVKPYYARFLEALPTIQDLAEAEEEKILKLWEGLGYYSRVRNMQTAAQTIMTEYHGKMPADHKALLGLKGIGSYTAGAVGSIAFDLPYPAVDGNVLRVMSRVFADGQDIMQQQTKRFWEQKIQTALTPQNAGEVNQALMELGATICLPNGTPKCEDCPLRVVCMAYQQGRMLGFPVKSEKKTRTQEFLSVCFLTDGTHIALHKRESGGLLANLWELPNIEKEKPLPEVLAEWGIWEAEIQPMRQRKHIFTHIEWHMEGYFVFVKQMTKEDTPFVWVTQAEQETNYALPSAFQKIWKDGLSEMQNMQMSIFEK